MELLRWVDAGLTATALGVLGYILLRRRHLLLTVRTKQWLLVGLLVLPLGVLLCNNQWASYGAQKTNFCGSCHVMHPYLDDMKNLHSDTLVAKHFRERWIPTDQCYTCHTNYGIFGPVQSKVRGLRHLWAYYATPPSAEVARPISLYEPFPDANCLACHAGARHMEESPTHQLVSEAMRSGEVSCIACHKSVHKMKEGEP